MRQTDDEHARQAFELAERLDAIAADIAINGLASLEQVAEVLERHRDGVAAERRGSDHIQKAGARR